MLTICQQVVNVTSKLFECPFKNRPRIFYRISLVKNQKTQTWNKQNTNIVIVKHQAT